MSFEWCFGAWAVMARRFCPLAVDRISRCHFGGSLWSCRNTAVMGSRSDSRRIALRVSYSFPLPKIELTFLEMYRGPGWGSIPSSCTSLIHTATPVAWYIRLRLPQCTTMVARPFPFLRRAPFPFPVSFPSASSFPLCMRLRDALCWERALRSCAGACG